MADRGSVTIRKAEMSDLQDIKRIADIHKTELGFIMRPVLVRSIEQEEIFVVANGEGIIGFMQYHHRLDSQTTLHNIVIQSNYRKRGFGHQLETALEMEARCRNQLHIQLKCPEDLPANNFYESVGYEKVDTEQGKLRRLNIWRKNLG
jgi:N-acetylglutamate synthase-like GNAT family acetyltransferase